MYVNNSFIPEEEQKIPAVMYCIAVLTVKTKRV
jgi:hypothetical protein